MSLSRIRTLLISDPAISALIGQKVHVGLAPQEEVTSFILLEEIALEPAPCKDGYSVMDTLIFSVTAVDPMYSKVEELLDNCRRVLAGYVGDEFVQVFYNGQEEMYDGTQDYFVKSHSYQSLITMS